MERIPRSGPKPRIVEFETVDHLSIHELRDLLIEAQRRLGGTPEINDLIAYTSTFLKLFDGKKLESEKARELRKRLEEQGVPKKYAAVLVSHLPVSVEEIGDILPRDVVASLSVEKREEIAKRLRETLKELRLE